MNGSALKSLFIVLKELANVLDKSIITTLVTPVPLHVRQCQWANKMNFIDPLRMLADEQRALGIEIKRLWFWRWSQARSIPAQHSSNDGAARSGHGLRSALRSADTSVSVEA